MTAELLEHHAGPWTEADYFALPSGTPQRIELFDGSLLVSPAPTGPHQYISMRLAGALEAGAPPGLVVVPAVNLRLKTGRIFVPDLIVTPDFRRDTFDASEVALISEIVSPGHAGTDRVLKMHLYAEAGIPWYLLVEPEHNAVDVRMTLYGLAEGHYLARTSVGSGERMRVSEPVKLDLDPAELLRR